MSDSGFEGPEGFDLPGFFLGTPEQIAAKMHEHEQLHHAMDQSWFLAVHNFIDTMSDEHTQTFTRLLMMVEKQPGFRQWVYGLMAGKDYWRDNKCSCDGDPHPRSKHDMLPPDWSEPMPFEQQPEPMPAEAKHWADDWMGTWPDQAGDLAMWLSRHDYPTLDKLTPEDVMKIFEVREVVANDGEFSYVCHHCGFVYQTLEDRMMRPPGKQNCEGCVHRAKWG